MDSNSKLNARKALNNLKMEIAFDLGYDYDELSDKVTSNAQSDSLEGHAKNILAGEQVGGMMSKKLVEAGEKMLVEKYNSQNNLK